MSMDTTTEAAIDKAGRLDVLVGQMIHERRMRDLWSADYDRDRHIAMALLHDLGRTGAGDGWATAAGELHVRVRRGAPDWESGYQALLTGIFAIIDGVETGATRSWMLTNLVALHGTEVPRWPDSAPYIDLREARDEPDAITRARNAGALEALSQIIGLLPAINPAVVGGLADEYGGFGGGVPDKTEENHG